MMRRFHFDWLLWNPKLVDMQELVDHGAIRDRDYSTWDTFCDDRLGLVSLPAGARGGCCVQSVIGAHIREGSGAKHPSSAQPAAFPQRRNK